MEEITKPNDMFAAILQTPDVSVFDLAKSDITLNNTQLLSKDFYKSTDIVKSSFTDDKGNFNDLAFNNAYNQAALKYSELGNDQQLAKALEWDPYDFTAPLEGKHFDVRPVISKDINPFKDEYSRVGLNSTSPGELSIKELAQKSNIFDSETNTWLNKSANDLSILDKFFGDTLTYATYDKDEEVIDPITNQITTHKKGDWKLDDNGNFYIEKLGNREIYGKQIVNPVDILTTEGSAFNKVDFLDSDGKSKSMASTAAKLVVEIAPFLIPGVQTFYGGYKMAMGLAYVLPTFYKAIEGLFTGDVSAGNESDLWKAMNSSQGYLAKYNQSSVSEEGNTSLFNFEQLGSMVSDIYSQIYEQRAAASLSLLFYKSKEVDYLEKLKGAAEKDLGRLAMIDKITGIERPDIGYEKLAQKAASKIQELSDVNKKRSLLAKDLNLAYMAMTQSADIYGDALAGGYDRRTAGAAALLAASGQFALMRNNPLGDWFLDKTVGYEQEKAGMLKAYKKELREKGYKEIQDNLTKMGVDKAAGKFALGKTFGKLKSKISNFIEESNTMSGIGGNIARNAAIEGIEEVSEQAVVDMSKGVIDFLSYTGVTSNKGSFGGLDVVFSEQGYQTYLANLVGGIVGGAMFETERSILTPMLNGKRPSLDLQYSMLDYISNGKTKEFLEVAKDYTDSFASDILSPIATEVNGEKVYLGAEKGLTQQQFLYKNIEQYVNGIENFLNSENVNQNNETWVRKAIVDELKLQDLKRTNADSFVISDVRMLLSKMIAIKDAINVLETNKQDTSGKLTELKEVKSKLDDINSGKRADHYYGLATFTLNKSLHDMFVDLDIEGYTKSTYNKNFNILEKPEQDKITAEFSSIMNDESQFKAKMEIMYAEFMKHNEIFSKVLENHGKDGYNIIRKNTFNFFKDNNTVIKNAIEKKDINTLKQLWTQIHSFNSSGNKSDIKNTDLTRNLDLDLGNFLLKSNVIELGLSNKEMAEKLNVPIEELDINLTGQNILLRLSQDVKEFSNITVGQLGEALNTTFSSYLSQNDKNTLINSVIKNNPPDTLLKDVLKPEVFNKVDFNSLSEEEQSFLSSRINNVIPTMDAYEAETLSEISNMINSNLLQQEINSSLEAISTLDPNDIENKTNLENHLNKLTNSKNFRVYTATPRFNKEAFIHKNLDNFYNRLLEVLSESKILENTIPSGLNPKETLLSLFTNGLVLTTDNKTVIVELIKNTLFEKLGEDIDYPSFSELSLILAHFIETSINEEITNEEFSNIIEKILKEDVSILLDVNFVPQTNAIVKTDSTLQNNVMGKYNNSSSNYTMEYTEKEYINPLAQLLVEFSKPTMDAGLALDNEIINEAKSELEKLNLENKGIITSREKRLADDLNSIINYGNKRNNQLLDILRQLQLDLFNETGVSTTMFDILKNINKQISLEVSLTNVKINPNNIKLLNRALQTLKMVKGVISAMTSTKDVMNIDTMLTNENLYGYNANFNKLYSKKGINTTFGILSAEDISLLKEEIKLLENNFKHLKLLAENNMAGTIQEQEKIKTAVINALLKKVYDAQDPYQLLKLKYINPTDEDKQEKSLLSEEQLREASTILDTEEKLIFIENAARNTFIGWVNELTTGTKEEKINIVLDSIFSNFKNNTTIENGRNSLLDSPDSDLTETMTNLENKDWYFYLHAMLASSSLDFIKIYKLYIEKELSLQDNYRAPFFTQQLVMREAFGYINGEEGKMIMSHSTSYLNPKLPSDREGNDLENFDENFKKGIKSASGLDISKLFFIRGSGGVGKSDILANFLMWVSSDPTIQILGKQLDRVVLAPTEKTKLVVEKSVTRNLNNTGITTNTLEKFIDSLFPDSTALSDRVKALSNNTEKILGKDVIKDGMIRFIPTGSNDILDSGIFVSDNTAVMTDATLDLLFKTQVSNTPKFVIIDEASKINSIQYQILNYLATYKNYYFVVLGDDLQEGTTIGNATSSLENIHMPTSMKLKSSIRSENIHQSDNIIALEYFTNEVKSFRQYGSSYPEPAVLNYSKDKGKLTGSLIVDTLTKETLELLDITKEILFITEDGTLSSDISNLVKTTLGDQVFQKIIVSKPDVLGQEFDQVVILAKLYDSEDEIKPKVTHKYSVASAKKAYTLLSRAKVATIVVEPSKEITSNYTLVQHNLSYPKTLDMNEIKVFLKDRFDKIQKLSDLKYNVDSFNFDNKGKEIEEKEHEEIEIFKELEDQSFIDVVTSNEDLNDIEFVKEVKTQIETEKSEENDVLDYEFNMTNSDLKVIGYSFYNNFGKELPDLTDPNSIIAWEKEVIESKDQLTDFAAFVRGRIGGYKYSKLSQVQTEDNKKHPVIKAFEDDLNIFIKTKNLILEKIVKGASTSNSVISIPTLFGKNYNLNIGENSQEIYLKIFKEKQYSQPYKQYINNKTITGDLVFLVANVDGIEISLSLLADKKTATDPNLNKKGNTESLKIIYSNILKSKKNIPITLKGNITLLSGVNTVYSEKSDTSLPSDIESIENMFPGATVQEYGAFRGPKTNVKGELDEDSLNYFMKELEDKLNTYNTTKIKVVKGIPIKQADGSFIYKRTNKEIPYQWFMFRPYVIVTYTSGEKNFQKLIPLYAKNRELKTVWSDFDEVYTELSRATITEEEKSNAMKKRASLINSYDSWKVVKEFILTATKNGLPYENIINWLSDAVNISLLITNRDEKASIVKIFTEEMLPLGNDLNNLEENISKNANLQKVFKSSDNYVNMLNALHIYINQSTHKFGDVEKAFNDFINTSPMKVYYTLRVGSLEVDDPIGEVLGKFNDKIFSEQYNLRYYIQPPTVLINLSSLQEVKLPVVTPSTTKKNVAASEISSFKIEILDPGMQDVIGKENIINLKNIGFDGQNQTKKLFDYVNNSPNPEALENLRFYLRDAYIKILKSWEEEIVNGMPSEKIKTGIQKELLEELKILDVNFVKALKYKKQVEESSVCKII